jgi:hypothetical protein
MNQSVSRTYRLGQCGGAVRDLIWTGDNIGLDGGENPAIIGLMDGSGRRRQVSLEQALAVAERIDPQTGYQRLSEALPAAAAEGYLHPADLSAWRAAEQRIADLMYESARDLDVSFWLVVEDRIEDGRRVSGVPLSPKFATEEQAQEAAVELKTTKPNAYVGCHTLFFHWSRAEDMAERKRLLGEICCAEPSHV